MFQESGQNHPEAGSGNTAAGILPVLNEFRILLQESADYHSDEASLAAVYRESLGVLRSLARRLASTSDRYVVAVVGLTNVGKSTFLNALLGTELAPRRNGPCTSAVIEFRHGDSLRVTAIRRDSIHRTSWMCANSADVRDRLQMIADDSGEYADGNVHRVVVEAPIALLESGLIIADTPGFGAAQIGDKSGTHENVVKEYLGSETSQVFWVVLAEQGIGQTEKSFHDAFFADVCDDVVVTGCEDWNHADRLRFKRRFAEKFQKPMLRFHFISGLRGLVARNAGDELGLAESGIRGLEERVVELSDAAGRVSSGAKSLVDLSSDLREWLLDYKGGRQRKLPHWWRPDSWLRWEEAYPDNPIKIALNRNLKQ